MKGKLALLVAVVILVALVAVSKGTNVEVTCGPTVTTPLGVRVLDGAQGTGAALRDHIQRPKSDVGLVRLALSTAKFIGTTWRSFTHALDGVAAPKDAAGLRSEVKRKQQVAVASCCPPGIPQGDHSPATPPLDPPPFDPKSAALGVGETWTAERIAASAVQVGQQKGVPRRGWVIIVTTGYVESGMRNLNYGDRDSVGWLQQRAGWGSVSERMNPPVAAGKFYDALVKVRNWQSRPMGEVAQAVQRSAFPDRYQTQVGKAEALVARVAGSGQGKVRVDGSKHYASAVTAQQFEAVEAALGMDLRVMQGGYGGTHYEASGTSHNYPGVLDVSPASPAIEKVFREHGFAAWARNISGRSNVGSGAHIHAVSLLDPETSKSPQLKSWERGENGLDGGKDPAPHYPVVPELQARIANPGVPEVTPQPVNCAPVVEGSFGPAGVGGEVQKVATLNPSGGNWQSTVKAGGYWYVNEAQDNYRRTVMHRVDANGRELDTLVIPGGAHAVSFGALGNTMYVTFSSCHGLGCSGKGGEEVRSFTYRPGRITKAETQSTGWRGQVSFDPAGTRAVVRSGNKYQAYDLRTRQPIGRRVVTSTGQRQGFGVKHDTLFVLTGPTNRAARVDTYSLTTGQKTGGQDVTHLGSDPRHREPEGIFGDMMGVKSGVGASRRLGIYRLSPATATVTPKEANA